MIQPSSRLARRGSSQSSPLHGVLEEAADLGRLEAAAPIQRLGELPVVTLQQVGGLGVVGFEHFRRPGQVDASATALAAVLFTEILQHPSPELVGACLPLRIGLAAQGLGRPDGGLIAGMHGRCALRALAGDQQVILRGKALQAVARVVAARRAERDPTVDGVRPQRQVDTPSGEVIGAGSCAFTLKGASVHRE